MTTTRPGLERVPFCSDPEDFRKSHEQFARDIEVLNERYDELAQRWPDEWCTIYDGEIFHSPQHLELMHLLIAHGVEPRRTAVTFRLLRTYGPLMFG